MGSALGRSWVSEGRHQPDKRLLAPGWLRPASCGKLAQGWATPCPLTRAGRALAGLGLTAAPLAAPAPHLRHR